MLGTPMTTPGLLSGPPSPLNPPAGEEQNPPPGLSPEQQFDLDLAVHVGLVRRLVEVIAAEAIYRGLVHDRSKGADPERRYFVENLTTLRDLEYGSPAYRDALAAIQPALDHHYRENPHHPQYHSRGVRGMTLVDVVEMFCDWCAATRNHASGNIENSITVNDARFGLGPVLTAVFENTARWLGSLGHIGPDGKPPLVAPPGAS